MHKRTSILLAAALMATTVLVTSSSQALPPGGPIVLMGIDAEDGGVGGHGPIATYIGVMADLLANTTNGGSGILVIGGGKTPGDNVTSFWNVVGSSNGAAVTFANGSSIATVGLDSFKAVVIASSVFQTPGGGLTQAENNDLAAREDDIHDFVNEGGGLFGTSQDGMSNPYGYINALGAFTTVTGLSYSAVTATAEGHAIGISDTDLDVCCWHDEYVTFPSFLNILVTNDADGKPAAIGGRRVIIPGDCATADLTATITRPATGRVYADDADTGASGSAEIIVKGTPLTIEATTSNPTATASVKFFVDGVLVGTDFSPPFSMTAPLALAPGAHSVRVRAQHATLPCRATEKVGFTVACFGLSPSITRPLAGHAYRNDVDLGTTVGDAVAITGLLTAQATSPDLPHTTRVEFSLDRRTAIPDSTGNPFEAVFDMTPLAPGPHTLSARLVETNPACSSIATIVIQKPDPAARASATGIIVRKNVPAEPIVIIGGAKTGAKGGSDFMRIQDQTLAPALDSAHAITDRAASSIDTSMSASSSSQIADISLLGGLITADVLTAKVRAALNYDLTGAVAADDGSRIVGLRIAGTPVDVVQPNQVVSLPGDRGYVVLQETLPVVQTTHAEITVNMIHVFLDPGAPASEIVIASAHAGANLAADQFTGPLNDIIHRDDDLDSRTDAGNTAAAAMPIAPGVYSGSIGKDDPADFYSFDAGQGERVLATITPSVRVTTQVESMPPGLPAATVPGVTSYAADVAASASVVPALTNVDAYLYDPDGVVRATSENGLSLPERIEINADKPYLPAGAKGRWILEIRRPASYPDAFYTISFGLLPESLADQNDAGQPGDAPAACAAARVLPPTATAAQEIENRPITGVIRDDDRGDSFQFHANAGQIITAAMKPDELDDGANFDLYLYGPATPGGPVDCGTVIGASTLGAVIAKGLPDAVYALPAQVSGEYVLEIRRVNAVANYYANLTVANPLPTIPGNDAGTGADAPNACAGAAPTGAGVYEGSLPDVPTNDTEDFYSVTLAGGQDLTVVMKPSELSNFDLDLFDGSCAAVPSDTSTVNHQPLSIPETVHIADAPAGVYRLGIHRVSGAGNYVLGIFVTP